MAHLLARLQASSLVKLGSVVVARPGQVATLSASEVAWRDVRPGHGVALVRPSQVARTLARHCSSEVAKIKEDYYTALGVGSGASQEEIKESFQRKAGQFDQWSDTGSAKYLLVLEAYETLRDPEARAAYDASGKRNEELGGMREGEKKHQQLYATEKEESDENNTNFIERYSDLKWWAMSLFALITLPKMFVWIIGGGGREWR